MFSHSFWQLDTRKQSDKIRHKFWYFMRGKIQTGGTWVLTSCDCSKTLLHKTLLQWVLRSSPNIVAAPSGIGVEVLLKSCSSMSAACLHMSASHMSQLRNPKFRPAPKLKLLKLWQRRLYQIFQTTYWILLILWLCLGQIWSIWARNLSSEYWHVYC